LGILGNELVKFELATAATGRRAGDAGNPFRIGDTVVEQFFDLLRGGAAAIADYFIFYVGMIIGHENLD